MPRKRKKNRGKFIVFEGLDGAGTTTQANLLGQYLENEKWPVIVTSEPTNGPVGFIIRLILSKRLVSTATNRELELLSHKSIALLFAADRLDHLQHLILPKLDEGVIVICDRYYLSSYAYQMGHDHKHLQWLYAINSHCIQPDLTIFLNTSTSVCEKRRGKHRWYQELYEDPAVLHQVAQNYTYVLEHVRQQGEAIEIIDGTSSEKVVFAEVVATIKKYFPAMFPEDLPLFSL